MGYDIDFVFDETETRETILLKMLAAGAIPDPFHEVGLFLYSPAGIKVQPTHQGYCLIGATGEKLLPGSGMIAVWLFQHESGQIKGDWADTRLSWGTTRENFRSIIEIIFDFSEKVSCRVYDGQIQAFITREDWQHFLEDSFFRSASRIANLLGSTSGNTEAASEAAVRTPVPSWAKGILGKSVEELGLGVRACNCLLKANIRTLGALITKTENDLLHESSCGLKSLRNINEVLASMGLSLGMEMLHDEDD